MMSLGWAGPDLAVRFRQAELMDDPDLDRDRRAAALRALGRVNRISLAARRVWLEVRRAHVSLRRPVRVLDVACGGGDVLIDVGRAARRSAVPVDLHGCDLNPVARAEARARGAAEDAVPRLFRLDVIREDLPRGYDVICCSLFLHHLDRTEAVELLRRMANASGHALLVQDLRRTKLGYILAWVGLHALTRSDVARIDGLRSVRAAFSVAEARALCTDAGLAGVRVEHAWPQRFAITWRRP